MEQINHTSLIILAAGKSSRFGYPKGLARLPSGRFWIEEQLVRACSSGFRDIAVVFGADYEVYCQHLPFLAGHQPKKENPDEIKALLLSQQLRLRLLRNYEPHSDSWTSLHIALNEVLKQKPPPENILIFLQPIDIPLPSTAVYQRLIDGFSQGIFAVIPLHAGKGGHPVLITPTLGGKILAAYKTCSRLDHFLRQQEPASIARVSIDDPQVILNLNTQEDWKNYIDLYSM